MKLIHLLSASAALVALSATAFAAPGDVTGEVDVTGNVTGACAVVVGEGSSSSFSGTINLGELAGANGKLVQRTGLAGPFSVICNSGAPHVSVSATSLMGAAAPPDATYTNVVGYTAHLTLVETTGSETFNAVSAPSSPTATTAALAHALSGAANNVTVAVDTLTSNGGILTAGNYGVANPSGTGGVIAITISPM